MQVSFQFCRSFFTRASVCEVCIPNRKIMDRYQRGLINKKRAQQHLESIRINSILFKEEKKLQYERDLNRTIVKNTKSYQEWIYEINESKRSIYKKYLDKIDETHPFLVDDYRMEVQKETARIDKFYKPLISREAALLHEKRKRGLIHIEPEPFYLEGLDEIIPLIHELIDSSNRPVMEIETEKKPKLIE